jgi:hypothetical protein
MLYEILTSNREELISRCRVKVGTHDSASSGSWVWGDAFEYTTASTTSSTSGPTTPPTPTSTVIRRDETDASVSYSGNWYSVSNTVLSGGVYYTSQFRGLEHKPAYRFSGRRGELEGIDPHPGSFGCGVVRTAYHNLDRVFATCESRNCVHPLLSFS